MTVYPFDIDSDADIIRVDDNITEIGGEAINQLRSAVFAIETELGIRPSGSLSSVAARLDVSLNQDGTIKASALTSVGLATLPITNNQVANTAGIQEFKLALDHSTSDLNTLITSNTGLLNSLTTFANAIDSDLSTHIGGGSLLIDGSPGRHVASHIDLNAVPSDVRDTGFTWTGLLDKDGNQRTASQVAEALLQINDDFVAHQNAVSAAHVATAITIDTTNFTAIPLTIDTTQKLADYLDDFQQITVGGHIATQHANGIPLIARSQGCNLPDGYRENVVPPTACSAFLVRAPNTSNVDDISTGDDIISFSPDNTGFLFDSQFSQVRVGDEITINYGTGFQATFLVDSLRFVPGSEWIVRINGTNLSDSDGYAFARIDRPQFDRRTEGVLAVAAANATPTGSFNNFLSSVIVGSPRGATAIGFGFDPGQLDSNHYNLYLEFYPTGNPADRIISMPAVDVTGDAGASVGSYTLEGVVQNINDKFREIGFNYRFIAFAENGNVGIMLADAIDCASFAIISGNNSTGTLIEGAFTQNIIGEAAGTDFDALGLGSAHANFASPSYLSSFADTTAAQIPTKVIVPQKNREYVVNGIRSDKFAPGWNTTMDANGDGYWDGYIVARTEVGSFTVETTYQINLDLKAAGLKPGKTIVIQPKVEFTDSSYFDVDYGRFIIKSVSFVPPCPGDPDITQITVISGIHAAGTGFTFSSGAGLAVRLYFSEDSVSFNNEQVINQTPTSEDYHRLHEIYIDESGKTFSHERARMLIQAGGGDLLDSTNFHIENVSPKLRGFRDDSTTFNKFVRFYVLAYDSITGEYDGYIGQRNPSNSNITKTGQVVRGRKNVVTRFYDETNVDYVDLIFTETATTLGTASDLLGGLTSPRYVDIEIFDTLKLQDEILLLATAEVNWDPPTGQNIIQRVTSRREFGSVDEEDFTPSAINFITAGDRALHANGVVRGFDLDFINPSDNREVFYKGGVALVNGRILAVNNQSATLPELLEDGYTTPATVDWAVCVNEQGELEPIVITTTKRQFFAEDNTSGNSYYVPSVTFNELVNTRQDLTPISLVTANIASVTISESDISDIRRFVANQDLIHQLTLAGEDYVGNFSTFDAVINWITQFGETSTRIVKIRGEFDVSSTIDLRGITTPVVFEGDGAVINVTANRGFLINSNVTFKDIRFTYNTAALSVSGTNRINSGNGCIYHAEGSNMENVGIINCTFSSSMAAERHPFIGAQLNNNDLVRKVSINDNFFEDTANDGYQATVAFVGLNAGSSSEPAVLTNVDISRNYVNKRQGCYITASDTSGTLDTPGVFASNVRIRDNGFGVIGYLVTSTPNAELKHSSGSEGLVRFPGLIIEGNQSELVITALDTGLIPAGFSNSNYTYPLGEVKIINNYLANINAVTGYDDVDSSSLIIRGNSFRANDLQFYLDTGGGFSPSSYVAISAREYDASSTLIISNNTVDGYGNNIDSLYGSGISATGSGKGIIESNTVNGFNNFGIIVGGNTEKYLVRNNSILRDGRSIVAYVSVAGADVVTDNYFDSPTVDGSSTSVVSSGTGAIVDRNINQTVTFNLSPGDGNFHIGDFIAGPQPFVASSTISIGPSSIGTTNDNFTRFSLADSSLQVDFFWNILGKSQLPINTRIVSFSVDWSTGSYVPSLTNDLSLIISQDPAGSSPVDETILINPPASSSGTLTLTPGDDFFNRFSNRLALRVWWVANRSTDITVGTLSLSNLRVVLRY